MDVNQNRTQSAIEDITNVAAGFVLSLAMQVVLAHFYGLKTSLGVDLQVTLWFTALSFVRGYVIPRFFNRGSK